MKANKLRAARSLIDTPDKWIQGNAANRFDGSPCVTALDSRAVQFCIGGALTRAEAAQADWRYVFINVKPSFDSVTLYNDAKGRTHAEVLAVMDQAIADAEREHTP